MMPGQYRMVPVFRARHDARIGRRGRAGVSGSMNLIRTPALRLLAVPAMARLPIDSATLAWPESGNIVVPPAQANALTGLAAEPDRRMLC